MSKTDQLKSKLKSVIIPENTPLSADTDGTKTPKTPADEGIDFFESAFKQGEKPIQVYELQLDPDGGPNKDRSVEYLSQMNLFVYFNRGARLFVHLSIDSMFNSHLTNIDGHAERFASQHN